MKKSNIYYNAVFKNNQMRDCAKKAAADLLISIDELKLENLEYYKKTDSEYDDIDQEMAVAVLRHKHKEKMKLK